MNIKVAKEQGNKVKGTVNLKFMKVLCQNNKEEKLQS